jgi:hypothetical protein
MVRPGDGAFTCEEPFASGTERESVGLWSLGRGLEEFGLLIPFRAGRTGPCSGRVALLCCCWYCGWGGGTCWGG